MTDRELLELAAKAAGLNILRREESAQDGHLNDREFFIIAETRLWGRPREWAPLDSDGDALRLAVTLHIEIEFGADDDGSLTLARALRANDRPLYLLEQHRKDQNAATRRAIVRAAAEIGKAMP